MAVFDGVCYTLSPTLPPARRTELAAVLDLNGAVPQPPYTHLIVLSASHGYNDVTEKSTMKIVTDRWVDRSVVLGKCQPEQYYSPDPAMIFSGVVACATDLSAPDLEVLSAGITALGGQWRIGLTRDVTHLFALRTGSDKYNTALHFAPQTHMCIVTPHWFDDSVRLGRRVPETPYTWPDPLVLRSGVTLEPDDDALTMEGRRRKPQGGTEADNNTNVPDEGKHVRVWDGRRILLSTSLELGDRSRGAIEAGIRRAGGVVVAIAESADEEAEEKAVDESDVYITRWRCGKAYFKAARASLLVGTLTWLFSVESSGALHSPLDSLLWYPTPRGGIPGLIDCEISVTNYTGAARDYLKRLIVLVGAKFTPNMSQSNKVLVAGFQPSPKTTRALSWSIPVVNHTWLEDCFVEWRSLTVGLERYIVYPTGVDFGKMLMTRNGEPSSSQSVPIPRVSGGAVPGGRGVGVIDIEQEEARDAEYRARAREADGTSMALLQDDAPQTTPGPHADLVKKTPSSSARRRGSVSTPRTTGPFVDHVIELPTEDEDADGRAIPANDGRRVKTPSGSRVGSKSSSAGLFSNGDIEVAPPLETSSKGKRGKGKERQKDVENPVEGDEDEDVFLTSRQSKARPAQRRQNDRGGQTEDEMEKQVSARASKPKRTKRAVGSDSAAGPANESDRESVPPRRPIGAGSATPVKSGMKPRPSSKSASKPRSVAGDESEDEVRKLAGEAVAVKKTGKRKEQPDKPTRNGEVATKGKKKEKAIQGRKETAQSTSRPRSPVRSSPSISPKARPLKRRLSVVVPSVPKDYFSSQQSVREEKEQSKGDDEHRREKGNATTASASRSKHLAPAASVCVVSAEASTSTSKRAKPLPAKSSTSRGGPRKSDPKPQVKSKSKSKPGGSKEAAKTHANEDEEMDDVEDDNDASMVVESMASSSRGGPRRSAANKASTRLREEIMPDVVSFEKERKQAKRRRSGDWESAASVREEEGEEKRQEKSGKRRKVSRDEEEEVEEAEVEVAVLAKPKPRLSIGKGKEKVSTTVGSDEEMDESPAKSKPGKKKTGGPRGKELGVIRLMTTGVALSDDVVKRLTKLGVQMTTKPMDCTHLVARGIVRTEKFLCAMSVSPYILTEEWANASAKGGKLLAESDYLLTDAAAEKKWSFKFTDALARAKGPDGGSNLFKQMTFYVTPKVSIDTKLLKNVVSAGGGQLQTTTPTVRILKGKADRYVVSCEEDKGIWRPLAQEGFKVYSPELLLRGALRQEIEWENRECRIAG